ncbi:hypothetical protein N2603_20635 [Bradyrhizobium huanghuaihaiense]|uniref:hypothetical protein n=1 Tax=Bradyrhizobium huanghuaihaiense TaxID=990078 RepID=UPI0021AB017B|nr:hypothetical protein [Bradyrhizobium sp. CB3035]UWU80781.1 hypothetical protein N2603_20635 [Bradyrhizobium sp. CB3035]
MMLHRKAFITALKLSRAILSLAAFLHLLAEISPVAAQPSDAIRCSYVARPDVSATLKGLQSNDEPTRLTAAGTLGQIGKDALPALMAAIPQFLRRNPEPSTWPPTQRDVAIVLTDVIRAIISDDRLSILRFRQCTTDTIIKSLTWAARGDNQRLRVNSANILANVVDNTTVCIVLHHLRDSNISTNGRANLLGVTNSMASYAYRENVNDISKTLEIVNAQIGSSIGFDQSRIIVRDIYSRLAESENKETSLQTSLKEYCGSYNFNVPLD